MQKSPKTNAEKTKKKEKKETYEPAPGTWLDDAYAQ